MAMLAVVASRTRVTVSGSWRARAVTGGPLVSGQACWGLRWCRARACRAGQRVGAVDLVAGGAKLLRPGRGRCHRRWASSISRAAWGWSA